MTAPGTLILYHPLRGNGSGRNHRLLRGLGLDAQGASALWLAPGLVSLALFAGLLTLAPSELAGRAYAAYGGVYIAASLLWLWLVEKQRPDTWDVTGAAICLVGAAVILFAPRAV